MKPAALLAGKFNRGCKTPLLNVSVAVDVDLENLKRLANTLYGEEWREPTIGYGDNGELYREILTVNGDVVMGEFCMPDENEAAFIAAANPAVVLRLIELAQKYLRE